MEGITWRISVGMAQARERTAITAVADGAVQAALPTDPVVHVPVRAQEDATIGIPVTTRNAGAMADGVGNTHPITDTATTIEVSAPARSLMATIVIVHGVATTGSAMSVSVVMVSAATNMVTGVATTAAVSVLVARVNAGNTGGALVPPRTAHACNRSGRNTCGQFGRNMKIRRFQRVLPNAICRSVRAMN